MVQTAQPDSVRLQNRGCLHVTGPDAAALLENVITNTMDRITEPGQLMHAGLLTPQGKIICAFFVRCLETGFLLETHADTLPELTKRLTMYRLRAKVDITDVSSRWSVLASKAVDAADHPDFSADPRHGALGARAHVSANDGVADTDAEWAYHDWRIDAGVAEFGYDFPTTTTFPHEANWDVQNGVDFKKGCFIGQEVVSRMLHKAVIRKRFATVQTVELHHNLSEGAAVEAGNVTLGQVTTLHSERRAGLAFLRLDRIAEAISGGGAITSGGIPIELVDGKLLAPFSNAANPADLAADSSKVVS